MDFYTELLKGAINWLYGDKGNHRMHPVLEAKTALKRGTITQEEYDALFPLFKAALAGKTSGKLLSSEFAHKDILQAAGFTWDGKAWIKEMAIGMEIPDGLLYAVWFAPC